jgi:hypothetical protein
MQNKKFILSILCLLIVNIFSVYATSENTSVQTLQILEQKISNPNLSILGIHEEITLKNLIVVGCLLIMVIAMLYDLMSTAGFIKNNLINLSIAIIISLIGTYGGVLYNITKYLSSISDTIFASSKSGALGLILVLVIAITIFIVLKFFMKFIRKDIAKSKEEERTNKLETLRKLQDIEYTSRPKRSQ